MPKSPAKVSLPSVDPPVAVPVLTPAQIEALLDGLSTEETVELLMVMRRHADSPLSTCAAATDWFHKRGVAPGGFVLFEETKGGVA